MRNFFKPKQSSSSDDDSSLSKVLIWMFFLILAIALALRAWQWLAPEPPFELLPQAIGLIEMASLEDASARSTIKAVPIPEFENTRILAVGVYTISSDEFPTGSIAIELARENQRFVEILEKPKTTVSEQVELLNVANKTDVVLGETSGVLIEPYQETIACIGPEKTGTVTVCEITKILIFEQNGLVISIGADGTHATEGEIISLAQTMLAQESI